MSLFTYKVSYFLLNQPLRLSLNTEFFDKYRKNHKYDQFHIFRSILVDLLDLKTFHLKFIK